MISTQFHNYTIAFIKQFAKYIIVIVMVNCKLYYANSHRADAFLTYTKQSFH